MSTTVLLAQNQSTPTSSEPAALERVSAPQPQWSAPLVTLPKQAVIPASREATGAELAKQMHLADLDNPFSMNYTGKTALKADTRITIDYERACQLADELGEIEYSFQEQAGDLARCEKTISRPVSNERIQVEVLAYKGNTENIAATIWLNQDMTARQAILTYEQVFQYLAYQFSRDTLSQEIYHIENRNQVHFRSAGGDFVGLLSYSYAHLQFSYSR